MHGQQPDSQPIATNHSPIYSLLMGVQPDASHAVCRPSSDLTDSDLQLQLLQALLQGQPSPSGILSGTPLHRLPFSGMGPARVGVMTGAGPMTGLLLDDNPGPSLNRAQLLQALFKLELEGQMPKVGHIAYYRRDTMQLLQPSQIFGKTVHMLLYLAKLMFTTSLFAALLIAQQDKK